MMRVDWTRHDALEGTFGRWRQRVRTYAAGLSLAIAVISALPDPRTMTSTAIVRSYERNDRLDPRECLDAHRVLTLPLELATRRSDGAGVN